MTSKNPLLLLRHQKDIPGSWLQGAQPLEATTILQNKPTRTAMVSEGACTSLQSDSREAPPKVTNVFEGGVNGEVCTPHPPLLISTPNCVTAVDEQNNALKQKDLVEECGSLSSSRKDTIEEQVARANATIGAYVHNNALDSLGYM